jgi:iron complex outermembrane recepter protein
MPYNNNKPRAAALAACLACGSVSAQSPAPPPHGLAEMSLEELGELPVTSVSGRAESLRSAPGSVFLISGEDIRRSAATSLPEALRLAPNLQVARLNSGQYAISARGFNNAIANKLLVLIDGRTIYSSLFSGVFWDFHDLMLEDIERIEVISGPGGTLWGANAVNGIINVITKTAAATQGTLVTAQRSRSQGGQEAARWGGRLGDTGHVRVYAMAIDRNNSQRANGFERADAASKQQLGFRADRGFGSGQLTMQGDAYQGEGSEPSNGLAPNLYGGNLLARWESTLRDGSPYRVQAYYDLQARDETTTFRNRNSTVDVQFAHEPRMPANQQLLWGVGYRSGHDVNAPSALIAFIPPERRLNWASVFAQHQLRIGAWQTTAGLKLERNSYTGLEWLPNLRLAYDHAGRASSWAAVSRVVRAPARIDRDFFFPGKAPFLIAGGPSFESEVASVAELGHRGTLHRVTYSGTLFRQNYDKLRGGNGGTPSQVANRIEGHVDGLEAWAQAQPWEFARFTVGYLQLRKHLRFSAPPVNTTSIPDLGNDPAHQWSLRGQFDLPARTELDLQVRHIGTLPAPLVPAYTVVDARLGWQVTPRLELSLLAQNLFDRQHAEFNDVSVASQFGRRVFLKAVWQL